MAREHAPIQIGLPAEPAWNMDRPATTRYIAFLSGDAMPDPGEAFIAAGETFAVAPADVRAVPVESGDVAWAFSCSIAGRAQPIFLWCERADPANTPDHEARDARWILLVESVLQTDPDARSPVEDAALLAATVARAGRERTILVFQPDMAAIFRKPEVALHFLAKPEGALLDERHLFRVEIGAHDREKGPYWLTTVGLHAVGRPELELLEIPPEELRAAAELLDALGSRLVTEAMPRAGEPFEVGPGLKVALVPADEAIETLARGSPGGAEARGKMPPGPRAAVCAAGRRGAFRPVWMPPHEVLEAVSRDESAYRVSDRTVAVRGRIAQRTWPEFLRVFAARSHHPASRFLVEVEHAGSDGFADAIWIEVDHADAGRVCGQPKFDRVSGRSLDGCPRLECPVEAIGDWVVTALRIPGWEQPLDVSAAQAALLERL